MTAGTKTASKTEIPKFTRLTVPIARKALENTGYKLDDDVYLRLDRRCACAIGTYVVAKLGEEEADALNREYGLGDPEDYLQEVDLGVSAKYLQGLEVGFEGWEPKEFVDDPSEADFKTGYQDGKRLRAAALAGRLPATEDMIYDAEENNP